MASRSPRLPVLCLVFLLMTWGTCPCVYAQMLGGEAGQGASPAAADTEAPGPTAPAATAPC